MHEHAWKYMKNHKKMHRNSTNHGKYIFFMKESACGTLWGRTELANTFSMHFFRCSMHFSCMFMYFLCIFPDCFVIFPDFLFFGGPITLAYWPVCNRSQIYYHVASNMLRDLWSIANRSKAWTGGFAILDPRASVYKKTYMYT